MFGFFSTEEVVPLSLIEGVLSFHSSRKQSPGKTIKVRLVLATKGEVDTPTVKVLMTDCQEQPGGSFLCSGVLNYKESKLPDLILKMGKAGVAGASRRQTKRFDFVARILSKELMNFRAVALNVNLHGALVQADGPVAPGDYMNLEFDLGSVGMRKLTLQAACIWCRPDPERDKNTYSVGVAFTEQHEATHQAWERLYSYLKANENSSVMMRTMAEDDHELPPSAQTDSVTQHAAPLGASQAPDLPDVQGGFTSQAVAAPTPVNKLSMGNAAAPAANNPIPPSSTPPILPPQAPGLGFGGTPAKPVDTGPPSFAPPAAPSFNTPPSRNSSKGFALGGATTGQPTFGSPSTPGNPGLQFPPPAPTGQSPGLQFPPPAPTGQSPGLQFPPPAPTGQSPGLQFPPPAPTGQSPGLQFPPPAPGQAPGAPSPGLQFPPPKPQDNQPGLQFPPPPPPGNWS